MNRAGANIRRFVRSRWAELLILTGGLAVVIMQRVVGYLGSWDIYHEELAAWRRQVVVLQHVRASHPGLHLPTTGRPQPPTLHVFALLPGAVASGLRWAALALLALLLVRAGYRLAALLVAGALYASAIPPLAITTMTPNTWGAYWWMLSTNASTGWALILAEVAAALVPATALVMATWNHRPRPQVRLGSVARHLAIPATVVLAFAALADVAQWQASIVVSGSFPFPTSFGDPLGTPEGFAVLGIAYLVAGALLATRSPSRRWTALAVALPPFASPYAFSATIAGPGWQFGQCLHDLATPAALAALGALSVRFGPALGALWIRTFRRVPEARAT